MSYKRPYSLMDIECLPNYLLVKWRDFDTGHISDFEMWPGHPLDAQRLRIKLSLFTAITFNGRNYDAVILAAALHGFDNAQLKFISDRIIQGRMKPWEAMREFGIPDVAGFDMIDLQEIPPKQGDDFFGPSLKIYGGKMHSQRIQEMPVEHTAHLTPELRPVVNSYCGNDLITTGDLLTQFLTQVKQREDISEQYGLDLRSRSDAQISEAVIKHQLSFKPERPHIPAGTQFFYKAPPFIYFQTQQLRDLLALVCSTAFVIGNSGTLKLPDALKALRVPIGSNAYTVRMGGLHSTETVCYHLASADVSLVDFDVASYYPKTIDTLGLYPQQIGPGFLSIFRKLMTARLAAKAAGNKKLADMLKIVINGAYGKLGSPYSVLYAPDLMLQVTLTGQLALLMLIEAQELNGVQCVQANTDGVVFKTTRALEPIRDSVCAWWQQVTGYVLESTPYAAIFSRDVNSYIAFKPDGEAKKKGEFADPVPVASSWPNPECQISVDAMVNYLRDGTPIERTVRECRDVRKFVAVRKVQGGGMFEGQKLGKAVRWYYSTRGSCITYATSGNLVAQSEGARPMMELTPDVPADTDFDYYITRSKRLLLTVGVKFVTN